MTNKHTPGPWVAGGSDINLGTWVSSRTGTRVCTLRQCEDDWANAALIAQAPDLLAERDRLLQVNAELVAALQAVTILASSSMAGAKANLSKAGSIARAALAKAKGE